MRHALLLLFSLTACTASDYREDADAQVYEILAAAAAHVTGQEKTFPLERPEDTLRKQLERDQELVIELDLPDTLDAAAENSRDYQRRKELLYQAGLALTREQNEFALRFSFDAQPTVVGVGDEALSHSMRGGLFASRNSPAGGRIVASFVNTYLVNLLSGGGIAESTSLLALSLTQPLLRGSGERIAREPLTQAERNVIYEMRAFERFRQTFAVQVVSQYYRLLEAIQNLESEEQNVVSTRLNRERVEAWVEASRLPPSDLDRAAQDEFSAQDRLNTARTNLQSSLDDLKLTLGLPTDAQIELDLHEIDNLLALPIEPVELDQQAAIQLALSRRLDYRTVVDDVEDAARQILLAEDALRAQLDFQATIEVPTEPNQPLKFDWSQAGWSVGFNLDLALNRLPERNVYRSALINMDLAIRTREQAADVIKGEIRDALRNLRRTYTSYKIRTAALQLSEERLERAKLMLEAGRSDTLTLVDAQRALLAEKLAVAGAVVDYAVARLQLLRDLGGLVLEPKGLRYDPALPLPLGPLPETGPEGEAGPPAQPTEPLDREPKKE